MPSNLRGLLVSVTATYGNGYCGFSLAMTVEFGDKYFKHTLNIHNEDFMKAADALKEDRVRWVEMANRGDYWEILHMEASSGKG